MLVLSRDAYAAILEHADEDAPREACGLMAGRIEGSVAHVASVHRTPNVAGAPRLAYEIDPETLLQTVETVEEHGLDVVGFYHSHPAGPAGPSRTDHEGTTWTGRHYLIASLARRPPTVDAWRWRGDGFEMDDVCVEPPD